MTPLAASALAVRHREGDHRPLGASDSLGDAWRDATSDAKLEPMPRYEYFKAGTPDRTGINPFTKQPIVIKGRPSIHRFWEIVLDGKTVLQCLGDVGGGSQRWARSHADEARARDAYAHVLQHVAAAEYEPRGEAILLGAPEPSRDVDPVLALWEPRIALAPDDGDAYRECAAALGPPRAEFARRSPADEAFLQAHRAPLLGSLAAWVDADEGRSLDVRWRHGFAHHARLAFDGDGSGEIPTVLDAALREPAGRFLRSLTIGMNRDGMPCDYGRAIAAIAAAAPPILETLFIGDFDYPDQVEISWTHIGNASPLWSLPSLRHLTLQGGAMFLGYIESPTLEHLEVRTGGLSKAAVRSLAGAEAPRLRTLRVWFGDQQYGADGEVADLAPLLGGGAFPELRELGLMNAEFTDELCGPLLASPLLPRLEQLDLSMGTLTDAGAAVLSAGAAKLRHLRRLDVSDNLLSEKGRRALGALGPLVHVGDQREMRTGERYVSVGE